MRSDYKAVLRLEVPVIVQLASRGMTVEQVLTLVPGAIIELPKPSDEELELLVNNKPIATGFAVKVGENFGLKVSFVGDIRQRIKAMGSESAQPAGDDEAISLADALLQGQ